ncbi:MAG: hypothetical protein PHC68_09010 [Syntrophorhabdaceae bacterium]|nr:hypothetical protein [Syntrophorhabdaceae bacterium]
MGLDELAHQVDIGLIFNLQQHNGEIAGNGVAPEAGLPAAVLEDDVRGRTQRGVGVYDRGGKTSVELRIGFYGIDLPQEHLAVCPRQIKNAVGEPPVMVFIHKV